MTNVIEGFKIDISSDEMSKILRKRANKAREEAARIEAAQARLAEEPALQARPIASKGSALSDLATLLQMSPPSIASIGGVGGPFGRSAGQSRAVIDSVAQQRRNDLTCVAESLDFAASHVIPGATYRVNAFGYLMGGGMRPSHYQIPAVRALAGGGSVIDDLGAGVEEILGE